MIVLDTDHLSVLQTPDAERRSRLVARLALAIEVIGTTIVNVEEQMRGWLAGIDCEGTTAESAGPFIQPLGKLIHLLR